MMERKQVLFATLFLTKFNSTIHEEIFIFDEEPNIFPDADAPRWMKVLGILIYLLNFPAIMVILAFVHFETQGFAGHFRTIINQLVSCINMLVSYIFFNLSSS